MQFIPNILTLLNLTCGFLAIATADLFWSPILILIAAIFDVFDGAAARWLKAESALGLQLDSLCDLVSFGVAPAILYWLLVPQESILLLLIPLALVIAGAWRLARFNTTEKSNDFIGLAIPASAICISGLTLAYHWDQPFVIYILDEVEFYIGIGLSLAFLMISHQKMFSFKGILGIDKYWIIALFFGLLFVGIIDYRLVMVAAIPLYVLLSIAKTVFDRR